MNSKAGFTLVEVLIYLGISLIIVFSAYNVLKLSKNLTSSSGTYMSVNAIRGAVLDMLKNDAAIKNSIDQNGSVFNCITKSQSCANKGGQFILYDARNQRVTEVARPGTSDGFTKDGKVCQGFNASAGNDACPYRYVVTWEPYCPVTGSCINPAIKFKATMEFKPKNPENFAQMRVGTYGLTVIKANTSASLLDACDKVGGTLQADLTCSLPHFNSICPPRQYIVGFTGNGKPLCRGLSGYRCPQGQVLLGMDANGQAFCGPGCSNPGSSSGSYW